MARRRKTATDGKCRAGTLRLMALSKRHGDELGLRIWRWERAKDNHVPRPTSLGVLVECRCPCPFLVAPASVSRRCFICNGWRKPVESA